MTVFLILLFIGLLIFRIAAGFFVEQVPFFAALITPLTWLCVASGIAAAIFVGIKVWKEIQSILDKRHKGE